MKNFIKSILLVSFMIIRKNNIFFCKSSGQKIVKIVEFIDRKWTLENVVGVENID